MALKKFDNILTEEQKYAAQRIAPALREQAHNAVEKAKQHRSATLSDTDPDTSAREQRAMDRERDRARRLFSEARSMEQAIAPKPKKRSWF